MQNVADFPLSPAVAKERIQALCRAGRIRLPTLQGGEWRQRVTTRQILLCLESGEMVGTGRRNDHGHYAYRLRRFAAGVAILVDVVLLVEEGEWLVRITGVSHE